MMNRFFTLLLAASCLTAVGQVPDNLATDGLLGWWAFDGPSSSEDLFDYTIVGEVTFGEDRHCNPSSSLAFNSMDSSYVDLGIPFPSGNATKSFALWIKPETDQYQWFVSGGTSVNGLAFGLFMDPNPCCPPLSFHGNGAQSDLRFSDIPTGEWSHVAITFSGYTVAAYLNGEFIANRPVDLATTSNSIWLGARNNNTAFLSGQIDNVGIWNRELSATEVLQLYEYSGCTNIGACNYDSGANFDDGSCDLFTCKCLEGTIWSEELGGCIVANPADINLDGCVQLNDLLDLLSAYGDCGAEESAWQCGDPLEYQGYDYETVQIGEQCWFAENLRAENYRNGDAIPANLSDGEWSSTSTGAVAVYGEGLSDCNGFNPDGNACDEYWSLNEYGRLYNWFAVDDARGLCPHAWSVPADGDWMELELILGLDSTLLYSAGYRGDSAGIQLRDDVGWFEGGNGNDAVGYSARPAGYRYAPSGTFSQAGKYAQIWTSSTITEEGAIARLLSFEEVGVKRSSMGRTRGISVRCIKDSE